MNATILQSICGQSQQNLAELFDTNEAAILDAIHATAAEAQDAQAEKIVVRLNHTIILDLTNNTQTDRLGISVARKFEVEGEIVDPNQPELKLDLVRKGKK